MNKKTLRFLLWFLLIWFGINMLLPKGDKEADTAFIFQATRPSYAQGAKVELLIENRFPYAVSYESDCPREPFDVSRTVNGTSTQLESTATHLDCQPQTIELAAGEKKLIDYGAWNRELFWELGSYSVVGNFERVGEESIVSDTTIGPAPSATAGTYSFEANFEVKNRGWFSTITQKVFYQPIYNFLIFLTSVLPGHNLGLAIILMTIAIRLVLFIPTLKSLASQQAMQVLQPKLQSIRDKHKDDQKKLAEETMKLYKEHGINPLGSCLPILIQMPFLFAVFYVLRSGLDPSNIYMLYGPLAHFDLASVSRHFLTFDMTLAEPLMRVGCEAGMSCFNAKSLIMPLLVGGLQGISSWIMLRRQKKGPQTAGPAQSQQKVMNIMMTYLIPLMVAWFAFTYPTGLSIYWAATTLFSIGQQAYLAERANLKTAAKQE